MSKDKIPTQPDLFSGQAKQSVPLKNVPSLDHYVGAITFSAVGDALGWATEFLNPYGHYRPPFSLPISNFVKWQKLVGGKWWGYEDVISPGQYSDDTQLMLAVARCISDTGSFEPDRFAYEELPLWLHYERGGGKSIKTAARRLVGKRADWSHNFYKQGDLDYRKAGANGAAMRNLPVTLSNFAHELDIIRESFLNAIITHGHPRAILGTLLFGLAANYSLMSGELTVTSLIDYLSSWIEQTEVAISTDDRIISWIQKWDRSNDSQDGLFLKLLGQTCQETRGYLEGISQLLTAEADSYYQFVGALHPSTKGSGVATVCAAIYLFLRFKDLPLEAMTTAVNMLGSDTDTIGSFLGALLGGYYGTEAIPSDMLNSIQDRDYLTKTAKRLHSIAAREQQEQSAINQIIERNEAYLRILAWEIGLHEMFWDAIDVGGKVTHPTIGRGTINQKETRRIRREDYLAKLIHIKFDCGQSCVFHSLVKNNSEVSESLSQDIEKALAPHQK